MKTAKKIVEELNLLDENDSIEAKKGEGDSLYETICAFANEPDLSGGIIIIGVEKESETLFPVYKVCGVENTDKILSDIASKCASIFNTPFRPSLRTEEVERKKVIIVEVAEIPPSEKPLYIKKKGLPNGAYRRIGSSDQKCTEEDLSILFNQSTYQTFDETIMNGATFTDIDLDTVEYYRKLRGRVNATAEELTWNDEELLHSLSAITKDNNEYKPTLAGMLLFGNRKALRRLLPMTRVDYIRIPGKEWVENPDERFSTTDMRGSLLHLVQRVQDLVYEDLPKPFALEEGQIQAQNQTLPARVLREAIVNALMHASYRVHQPIQILRYSNRIEIRNAGYSLKNEDQLGEPRSQSRNPRIAAVFHETNLAETKGSGIRIMRKLMQEKGFAPPTFESDRGNNQFIARLLLHHFLTDKDIEWLESLQISLPLNDGQKVALIFVREMGAINNQTYRQLNATDTLTSSNDLRRLRDIEILEKKGNGSATYYVVGIKLKFAFQQDREKITHQYDTNTHMPDTNTHMPDTNTHMLDTNTHMLTLPFELKQEIQMLGKRPRISKLKELILKLCKWQNLSSHEIVCFLQRTDKQHLVRTILNPMIDEGLIEYTIAESPKHPYQKYKAVQTDEDNE